MFAQCIDGGDCSRFLRRDATLVAIFMSDEQNWGPMTTPDIVTIVDAMCSVCLFLMLLSPFDVKTIRQPDLINTPSTGMTRLVIIEENKHFNSNFISLWKILTSTQRSLQTDLERRSHSRPNDECRCI